jgi:hypothetical protein
MLGKAIISSVGAKNGIPILGGLLHDRAKALLKPNQVLLQKA